MSGREIGVGIIGLGLISDGHELGYQHAADRAKIVAVCDVDGKLAAQRAEMYNARAYLDHRDLLNDSNVQLVDIILPHHLHYSVALAALERRKHVLVEKPMATSAAQALALCEEAMRAGVRFTVAENTRFVAAYIEAARLLKRGVLGELRSIRTCISGSEVARLQAPNHWKGRREGAGGGVVMDAGPHSIYLLKWLGGDIEEVRGFSQKIVKESEVEDNSIVTGTLKRGAIFVTEYSFTVEIPWSERLEIHGTRGSLVIDQLVDPPARHYRGARDFEPLPLTTVPYNPKGWKRQSIAAGVTDFVNAVWENRSPTVDPLDGVYAIKVVEKIYESIASATVIKV